MISLSDKRQDERRRSSYPPYDSYSPTRNRTRIRKYAPQLRQERHTQTQTHTHSMSYYNKASESRNGYDENYDLVSFRHSRLRFEPGSSFARGNVRVGCASRRGWTPSIDDQRILKSKRSKGDEGDAGYGAARRTGVNLETIKKQGGKGKSYLSLGR